MFGAYGVINLKQQISLSRASIRSSKEAYLSIKILRKTDNLATGLNVAQCDDETLLAGVAELVDLLTKTFSSVQGTVLCHKSAHSVSQWY